MRWRVPAPTPGRRPCAAGTGSTPTSAGRCSGPSTAACDWSKAKIMSLTNRPCALVTGAAGSIVSRAFEDRDIEYVFHLAAYAAEGLSHYIRRFNYTNNVIGSVTLVNEAI